MNYIKIAGFLLFLASATVLMGIITAEAFYPSGYSTFKNEISDLGATRQPNSVSYEPSATIFNMIMLAAGLMILFASFYQHKHFHKLAFSIPFILFGIGLVGIGVFPGNKRPFHGMASMLAFLSGGLCAITSSVIIKRPFKYLSILFGIVALLTYSLAVFAPASISSIGIGGTERWVAYPIMLWGTGFGGYLMNQESNGKLLL